jgi:hypothetical protein
LPRHLIPERTIDAWAARAIALQARNALLWCPTPPSQSTKGVPVPPPANVFPWDLAMQLPGTPGCTYTKAVVFEHKALVADDPPRVVVDTNQLDYLCQWEAQGAPIYYGLPAPIGSLPRSNSIVPAAAFSLFMQGGFANWQRVARPSSVRSALGGRGVSRNTPRLNVLTVTNWEALDGFLRQMRVCSPMHGARIGPQRPNWIPVEPISDSRLFGTQWVVIGPQRTTPGTQPSAQTGQDGFAS